MTLWVPPNYVEHLHQLALGVEPVDAMLGARISDPLRVMVDGIPFPKPPWGNTPSTHWFEYPTSLKPLIRKNSCLYSLLGPAADPEVAVRIYDKTRRFVPRRFNITLGDGNVSIVSPHLFPGAGYDLSYTATGLRGRVLFHPSKEPFRWARIVATMPIGGTIVGRAHTDDRGDFVLLLSSAALGIGAIVNPIQVEVRVFGRASPQPPPATPQLPRQDPLWDLPVEDVPPDTALTGEELPLNYVERDTWNGQGAPAFASPRVVDFQPGALKTTNDEFPFFVQ